MRKFFFFSFFLSFSILSAQEVLSNLISNPVLNKNKFIIKYSKSPLVLPFFDDFSYDSNTVTSNLWFQSSVFVNRTYALNPPTIGVATFDGLDAFGFARDFNQFNNSEPSDTLLSRQIDLSLSNSVYLMFYYQAKGIGDSPELQDKLVLEFFISNHFSRASCTLFSPKSLCPYSIKGKMFIIEKVLLTAIIFTLDSKFKLFKFISLLISIRLLILLCIRKLHTCLLLFQPIKKKIF